MDQYFAVFENESLVGIYKNAVPQRIRVIAEEIVAITDLDHLVTEMERRNHGHTTSFSGDIDMVNIELFSGLSDSLDSCLNKLDEMGISPEKIDAKVREGGKKFASEVKSMGVKGLTGLRDKLRDFTELIDNVVSESEERPMPNGGE